MTTFARPWRQSGGGKECNAQGGLFGRDSGHKSHAADATSIALTPVNVSAVADIVIRQVVEGALCPLVDTSKSAREEPAKYDDEPRCANRMPPSGALERAGVRPKALEEGHGIQLGFNAMRPCGILGGFVNLSEGFGSKSRLNGAGYQGRRGLNGSHWPDAAESDGRWSRKGVYLSGMYHKKSERFEETNEVRTLHPPVVQDGDACSLVVQDEDGIEDSLLEFTTRQHVVPQMTAASAAIKAAAAVRADAAAGATEAVRKSAASAAVEASMAAVTCAATSTGIWSGSGPLDRTCERVTSPVERMGLMNENVYTVDTRCPWEGALGRICRQLRNYKSSRHNDPMGLQLQSEWFAAYQPSQMPQSSKRQVMWTATTLMTEALLHTSARRKRCVDVSNIGEVANCIRHYGCCCECDAKHSAVTTALSHLASSTRMGPRILKRWENALGDRTS